MIVLFAYYCMAGLSHRVLVQVVPHLDYHYIEVMDPVGSDKLITFDRFRQRRACH